MLQLPYGIADFQALISDGYEYIDRTSYIHDLESLGRHLLFVRPRRFGKSLWLGTLAAYYDLRTAGAHQELFGHLDVGRSPTPDAHRYFVLQWDFSEVSPRGSLERVAGSLNDYVNTELEVFLSDYGDHLPRIAVRSDARNTFIEVLAAIRKTPHSLYLLIDEYDNFANEIMVRDESTYGGLVHGAGPFKELMKSVKRATQGRGLERLFVTGVSPVVMSDLSSGMNILTDVYQRPELNGLCGFKDDEVLSLLERIHAQDRSPTWTVKETQATIRDWYNGYRFSPGSRDKVFNPTMVLYFLDYLQRYRGSPRRLLDHNLAADEDKLRFIGQVVAGQQTVLDVVQKDAPVEIDDLAGRFTLNEILEQSAYDQSSLASFLTYFGMLTIERETPEGNLHLAPPNMVVRKLYVDQVRRFLLPQGADRTAAWRHAQAVVTRGEIAPFLAFVEEKLFPVMSNRDYIFMDEQSLKMVFLTLLWGEVTHLVVSEPELSRGYADLCLLRRPDRRMPGVYDLVFEFKYAKLGDLGLSGEELRQMDLEEIDQLELVEELFTEAETQLQRYREALLERYGEALQLRAFAVVALGFERLVARELTS